MALPGCHSKNAIPAASFSKIIGKVTREFLQKYTIQAFFVDHNRDFLFDQHASGWPDQLSGWIGPKDRLTSQQTKGDFSGKLLMADFWTFVESLAFILSWPFFFCLCALSLPLLLIFKTSSLSPYEGTCLCSWCTCLSGR